ncbi:PREDICTED: uncharacterized protein LOC108372503 [Rhagoletis zephyria]|uniref:uncharacterized protein LOC108372503 n=1 Tax=Rhagoletis zephyria TaxID=28612 RepID=UPI00081177CC|nr:PREDICTED: uncharacterized protein LOC108372503 [Rhagoletis zephyria]XP_017483703.1 PREDICTED: uncharacterized protein LOC108372503 [Rhagoletis zephyria]XP_017483705.1 PREDICTED: uncharacterized protein LOC108372503 [Rhagoletis zephyria]
MESAASVQVVCNWERIGGCEFSQSVQTKITHEDIFIKPELEQVIGKQNAVLLKRDDTNNPCEIHLQLKVPIYKIESITTVCTAPKLELFLGPLKEYTETLYGETAEDDENGDVFSYRYDIEVQKSGITECTLKLLTSSDEICIFGFLLQIAPNPNGITTGVDINFHNVQKMLSSQKISPSAEKCMLFMKAANQMKGVAGGGQSSLALLEQMKTALAGKVQSAKGGEDYSNINEGNSPNPAHLPLLDPVLKTHIDNKFDQLEHKITAHLDKALVDQNDKLDKILQILENRNIFK